MFIHENDDGSVVYTGSFNKAVWDAYWHERGELAPAAGGFKSEAEVQAEAEAVESDDDGEAGAEVPADPPDEPENPPVKKTAKKAAKKTAATAKKDGD